MRTLDLCVCMCVCVFGRLAANMIICGLANFSRPDGLIPLVSIGEQRRAERTRAGPCRKEDESSLITKASNCPPQPRNPTSALNSNYGENTVHCHPILSCWRAGRANRWTLWLWRGGGRRGTEGMKKSAMPLTFSGNRQHPKPSWLMRTPLGGSRNDCRAIILSQPLAVAP